MITVQTASSLKHGTAQAGVLQVTLQLTAQVPANLSAQRATSGRTAPAFQHRPRLQAAQVFLQTRSGTQFQA